MLQAYIREGKCHLMLGNAMAAYKSYNHVLELEPNNSAAIEDVSLHG